MYFFRVYVWLLLLASVLLLDASATRDVSRRSDEGYMVATPIEDGKEFVPRSALTASTEEKQNFQPIRIHFDTSMLHNRTATCRQLSQMVSDGLGTSVICREEDLLTAEKRDYMELQILPRVKEMVEQLLLVRPLTSALRIPTGICGSYIHIPPEHASMGVKKVDFIVYVVSVPMAVVSSNTIAWGGSCGTIQHSRPAVARVNLVPKHVRLPNASAGLLDGDVERYSRAILHEVFHCLGFSPRYLEKMTDASGGFSAPDILSTARAYFNCSAMSRIPLENEGGEGSAGAHWERSILKEEIMSGVIPEGVYPKITNFTLSVFQLMPFYAVNFSFSERMEWGYQAGSAFLKSKCGSSASMTEEVQQAVTQSRPLHRDMVSQLKHWCTGDLYKSLLLTNSSSPYTRSSPFQCNVGRTGMGRCSKGGSLLIKDCNTVDITDVMCRQSGLNEHVNDFSAQTHSIVYQGPQSSCFMTSRFEKVENVPQSRWNVWAKLKSAWKGTANRYPVRPVCARSRCVAHPDNQSVFIQIQLGVSWVSCPANGAPGILSLSSATGYKGSVFCEDAQVFCGVGESTQKRRAFASFELLLSLPVDTQLGVNEGERFDTFLQLRASADIEFLLQHLQFSVDTSVLRRVVVSGYALVNETGTPPLLFISGVYLTDSPPPNASAYLTAITFGFPSFAARYLLNATNTSVLVERMTVGEVLTPYDETVPPSLPALFATATIRMEVQWNTKRPSVDQPIKVKRALQRDLSRLLLTAVDWIEIREGSLSSCTVPSGGKHCDAFVFEFYPYLSSRLSGDLFVGHGLYLLHDAYRAALSPSTKADFVFLLEALGSDVAGNSFRVVHVNVTKAHP